MKEDMEDNSRKRNKKLQMAREIMWCGEVLMAVDVPKRIEDEAEEDLR